MEKIVLPTAWDLENKSSILELSSDGLRVSHIGPDIYEVSAPVIRTNNPIPSQCELFYFEIRIIDNGKYGTIAIGFQINDDPNSSDSDIILNDGSDIIPMLGQRYNSWGYHGDNGYSFCSGRGRPYGPPYSIDDIIGCYLNFRNKMVFYTKNGVNLGIACLLPDNLKPTGNLYPCVGLSQGGSAEINFGQKKFKYLTMNNDDIDKVKNWLNIKSLDLYYDELTQLLKGQPKNTILLMYRGKVCLIMGRYEEAITVLTKLLEIEPNDVAALRYRAEANFLMKRYNETNVDLKKLLEINQDDTWAIDTYDIIPKQFKTIPYSDIVFSREE